AGELFNMAAGANLVHVPYRGNGPALAALLGGEIEVLFPTPPSSIEYIRTGKLRGLATTGAMRSEALPDLPAAGEFVAGYETSAWYGVGGAQRTPLPGAPKHHHEKNAGTGRPPREARVAPPARAPA